MEDAGQSGNLELSNSIDFGALYDHLSTVQREANKKYIEAYNDMVKSIKEAQFEPIAKLLLEREKTVLEVDIDVFRSKILEALLFQHNTFWETTGAAINQLELLKEQFKDFEGQDWKMHEKSPEERLIPHRTQLAKRKLAFFQEEIAAQEVIIKEKYEEIHKKRERLNDTMVQSGVVQNRLDTFKDRVKPTVELMMKELLSPNDSEDIRKPTDETIMELSESFKFKLNNEKIEALNAEDDGTNDVNKSVPPKDTDSK